MKTLLEKRAIKITELTEELEEAKRIIRDFVWPGDCDEAGRRRFIAKAARFAGATEPVWSDQNEVLPNVRDQQAPLASGATPCASKERDRSPGGTGLCCIALFAVSLCGCAGPKIDYASRAEYWKNYRHTDGTKCPEAESNAKWYEQNTTN